MRLNFTANSFIFGRINREIAPRTFLCISQSENFQNASQFHVKQLHFWTHKSWNCAQNFFVHLAKRKFPKCVSTSQQTASFLDAWIVKMRPERFLQNLQAENFQNASELHGKQLRFWTHNSWNCAQNFFCKTCRQKTS